MSKHRLKMIIRINELLISIECLVNEKIQMNLYAIAIIARVVLVNNTKIIVM